jgi:hypothetical protein
MKGATCHFCGGSFRNRQAVRAHLKSCPGYRQLPKATLPNVGSKPGTLGSRDTHPRLGPTWEPVPDANPSRPLASPSAAGTGQKAQLTGLARWMIQSVKDEVIGKWWSPNHTIPSETKAQALIAIEQELPRLPVDQLPRSELKTIAEGIRDRYYRPVIQAQQRAREDEERKQNQARERTRLIAAGTAQASRALRQQENLDGLTRLELEQKVKRALEQDIGGSESEADVHAQVNKMLERELKPIQQEAREKVRQQLIAHGVAYAKDALDCEEDLEAWDRSQIERDVKQALHQEITGEESQDDVERRVDELLDQILPETDENDEEDEWDEEDDDEEDEED